MSTEKPVAAWQQKRDELQLSDEKISYNVKDKIKKFTRLARELDEYNESYQDAFSQLEGFREGSTPYKTKLRDVKALKEAATDWEKKISVLDEELTRDMIRLDKDKAIIEKSRAAMKKINGSKDQNSSNQTKPNTGTEQAATSAGIPLIITTELRNKLYELKYTEADVDKMTPESAHTLVNNNTMKQTETTPAADNTVDNKGENSAENQTQPAETNASTSGQQSGQQPEQNATGPAETSTPAKPQAPVKQMVPKEQALKKTAAASGEKKDNTGKVVVGVLVGIGAVVAGIFGIRWYRNRNK